MLGGTVVAMGKLDPDDVRPPYKQVADGLRADITSGVISAGHKLPKQEELAHEYGVSVGTVKSGLTVLRDEGLIVSRQGEGSWVRKDASATKQLDETEGSPTNGTEVQALLREVLERLDGIERLLSERADQS